MNYHDPIISSMPAAGYTAVLGAAGCGKTTAALKRAVYFARKPEQPRVLLVTWNRLLAAQLLEQSAAQTLPRRLTVESFPDLAVQLLKRNGVFTGSARVLDPHRRMQYIRQALRNCQAAYPGEPLFFMPAELFSAEIRMMAHTEAPADTRMQTNGAAHAELRRCAELVREKYLELRTLGGWRFDADELPAAVCRMFRSGDAAERWDHIIADDAQDYSPAMLTVLYNLLEPGGSLTLFADPGQQLSDSRCHWCDAGLPIGQTLEMKGCLRGTATVRRFLTALRTQQPQENLPQVQLYPDPETELADIAVRAQRLSRTAPTAILCRTDADVLRIRRFLIRQTGDHGSIVLHGNTAAGLHERAVYLGTYREVRGLEFPHVLMPFLSAGHLPHPKALLRTLHPQDAFDRERRLLCCAAARAAQTLYLSASGSVSPLLPEGCISGSSGQLLH